jgi:glucose-1-phosphate thymidylyltransferase
VRGIILAGGTGSRLKPTTNIISKHLLPVFDKPMIYYPISVLMMADIQDITILINETDYEQYNSLLGDGTHLGLKINYVFQPSASGLADALRCALENNQSENVCVILGDNIFYGKGVYEPIKSASKEMNGATIFVQAVKDPERFGIVEMDGSNVLSIEEKPVTPKSNLAITGLYIFDSHAYEFCNNLKPSIRAELEITDLLKLYHAEASLKHVDLGRGVSWFDAGVPQSMLKAGSLIALLQEKQNTLIACLEEIAFSKGWIDKELLEFSVRRHQGSEYGSYLQSIG